MLILEKITLSGESYPYKLKTTQLKVRLSYNKLLLDLVDDLKSTEKAYRYFIRDTDHSFFEAYDKEGNCLYRNNVLLDRVPFKGEDNPRFKKGQIVAVSLHDEVRLGCITACPPTTDYVKGIKFKLDSSDNVYLVDFSEDSSEHAHPFEFMLETPLEFPYEEEVRLKACFDKKQALLEEMKKGKTK